MKTEIHVHKYMNFKKEAEKAGYPPSKIGNYFLACFHLIEAFAFFKSGVHIQKHQMVRRVLEENKRIFGENTEKVWRGFEELDNQVRAATSYGGKENGGMAEKAGKVLKETEELCGELIAKKI